MYCHKCGTENKKENIFCENCGEKLYSKTIDQQAKENKKGFVKEVGKELATTTVNVTTSTIKKSHHIAFKVGIITAIVAFIIAIANYYCTYMVSSPDKTVKTFMEASDKLDYNTMVECFDSKTQNLLNTGGNLAMGFIGAVTGFSLDFQTATTITSAFGEEMVSEEQKCNATNFKVEKIEGEKLSAFVEQFGTKIKSIGNVLGSTAIVSFEVDNKSACIANSNIAPSSSASRLKYQIEVKNYGKEGWKIPREVNFQYLGEVN